MVGARACSLRPSVLLGSRALLPGGGPCYRTSTTPPPSSFNEVPGGQRLPPPPDNSLEHRAQARQARPFTAVASAELLTCCIRSPKEPIPAPGSNSMPCCTRSASPSAFSAIQIIACMTSSKGTAFASDEPHDGGGDGERGRFLGFSLSWRPPIQSPASRQRQPREWSSRMQRQLDHAANRHQISKAAF